MVKFSHVLNVERLEEWKQFYLNYSALKKLVYQIVSAQGARALQDGIQAPLVNSVESLEKDFEGALNQELAKIVQFSLAKQSELLSALEDLDLRAHRVQGPRSSRRTQSVEAAMEAGVADGPPAGGRRLERASSALDPTFWLADVSPATARERERLRSELNELYVKLHGLLDYVQLNHTGFRKILKKHDKSTDLDLKDDIMPIVEEKLRPDRTKQDLQAALDKLGGMYAAVCCQGNKFTAESELKSHLKQKVDFERETVWLEMLAGERKKAGAQVVAPPPTGWRRFYRPLVLAAAVLVFVVLLDLPGAFVDAPEKRHCLALLVLVSILWCTEALPLFVTAMLVPLLTVLLRVMTDSSQSPPVRLTAQQAAPLIFHAMFSQVIMLLLGGFAIASALTKYFIAKSLAVGVLSAVDRTPRNVLLAIMGVATFLSMWISNVAAPVICFSVIQPILRTLPPQHMFAKSLVMGIALASNLGGMTSPISSPQNIFAIERMSMDGQAPSWLAWFFVALPVAIIGNLLCWLVILGWYRPGSHLREVTRLHPSKDPITRTQCVVVVVSVGTVVLWCCNTFLQSFVGEMGVVAILPLVAFFGFGILGKEDFTTFPWHVVMLAQGGLALGEAVKSSGLLVSIATFISQAVARYQLGVFAVHAVFCLLVLICTTFISHTVGAMVILPIVQSVGEQMPGAPHAKLLVMGAALMCSGAMGLPVSGFPNINAVAQEDLTGKPYLNTLDFVRSGVPSSILAYLVVISVGYMLMSLVGF
ncbi:hypothetical protein WJX72_001792 [[Myrmecia] bisecta]|uniref:SPX domain-containing protein n=1 Tax=[Myrmecia] bisecta TaxID=41462 RepID=A0AAW1R426_9CHLO